MPDLLKVLLIGKGGREHAMAWKLDQSPLLAKLYVAPGNAGTAAIAENVPIDPTNIEGLLKFALDYQIDVTIVGPDDPLALGIVDRFQDQDLKIFGPSKLAAEIESSKVFGKSAMKTAHVPTAPSTVVDHHSRALAVVRHHFLTNPTEKFVIKASGLALGKGSYTCSTLEEAEEALNEIMIRRVHKSAGDEVLIEPFLIGQEISLHVFSDGKAYRMFPSAQDHKQAHDGDRGPNTGGMGTIAPVPWFTDGDMSLTSHTIVAPILTALKVMDRPFTGLLYPGIMMTQDGPKVLEFNARGGDPETQVYMRLLKSDLLGIIMACVEGRLNEVEIEWNSGFAVNIVLVSDGYPGPYKKGRPITGIKKAENLPGVVVFHAGTQVVADVVVTDGGRVLGVSAVGETLDQALNSAYEAIEFIHFDGMDYRTDIGRRPAPAW